MKIKKLKHLLYLFSITCMLAGCSQMGNYENYTIGSKVKVLGHAFHSLMFTLSMYGKLYAVILLIEFIAILLSLYEEKKLKFFINSFMYSILIFGFIMLFEPFLNTLKWILSLVVI